MPINAKEDNNVPFTGSRPRYRILDTSPSWVYHKMAAGSSLSGAAPRTTSLAEADLDPAVSAGMAEFSGLSQGGLFTHLGRYMQPLLIEAVDNQAGATITIVSQDGTTLRALPTSLPFAVGPGELIKATGGSAGGRVGVLAKIAGEKIF